MTKPNEDLRSHQLMLIKFIFKNDFEEQTKRRLRVVITNILKLNIRY